MLQILYLQLLIVFLVKTVKMIIKHRILTISKIITSDNIDDKIKIVNNINSGNTK